MKKREILDTGLFQANVIEGFGTFSFSAAELMSRTTGLAEALGTKSSLSSPRHSPTTGPPANHGVASVFNFPQH